LAERAFAYFSAFLATELVKRGWSVGYSIEKGVLLQGLQREINPALVVQELATGKLSRDEFLSILAGALSNNSLPFSLDTRPISGKIQV
jgi:hypothetical protein